jgi:hypothetical protein
MVGRMVYDHRFECIAQVPVEGKQCVVVNRQLVVLMNE